MRKERHQEVKNPKLHSSVSRFLSLTTIDMWAGARVLAVGCSAATLPSTLYMPVAISSLAPVVTTERPDFDSCFGEEENRWAKSSLVENPCYIERGKNVNTSNSITQL